MTCTSFCFQISIHVTINSLNTSHLTAHKISISNFYQNTYWDCAFPFASNNWLFYSTSLSRRMNCSKNKLCIPHNLLHNNLWMNGYTIELPVWLKSCRLHKVHQIKSIFVRMPTAVSSSSKYFITNRPVYHIIYSILNTTYENFQPADWLCCLFHSF